MPGTIPLEKWREVSGLRQGAGDANVSRKGWDSSPFPSLWPVSLTERCRNQDTPPPLPPPPDTRPQLKIKVTFAQDREQWLKRRPELLRGNQNLSTTTPRRRGLFWLLAAYGTGSWK